MTDKIGEWTRAEYLAIMAHRAEDRFPNISAKEAREVAGKSWTFAAAYISQHPEAARSAETVLEAGRAYAEEVTAVQRQGNDPSGLYADREWTLGFERLAEHFAGIGGARGAAVSVDREPLPDNDPTPPHNNGGAAMARPEAETSFTADDLPPSPNYEITEGGKVRIMDGAREAIERLAALVPEPTEADVTRHMMTGEEPRTLSALQKAEQRANTPEAKAARLADRATMQTRGYDGPEL